VYEVISMEEMGKPTVSLINKGFMNDAQSAASSKGWPGLRFVSERVPSECSVTEQIDAALDDAMDAIVAGLCEPLSAQEASPKPRDGREQSRIIFKGSLEEVNRFFYRRGWGDGLPLIPPTEEAVAEMLTGTDLPADHVVAKIIPRLGKATIERIAVNAVMAGALPTYMPVLIAGVKALADPLSAFTAWEVSTGSWAPFWVINGPIRHDLHVNSGSGALSPGDIANAAIGRAMGLIVKNIGGARKGVEDMGTFGNPGKYSMVLAENEEENPWEPLHVGQGLVREDSALTVSFPNCFWTLWPTGTDEETLLRALSEGLTPSGAGQTWTNVLLLPSHAKTLADKGWTKETLVKFVNDHAKPGVAKDFTSPTDGKGDVRVVICGGPGSWIVLTKGGRGLTKKIELPAHWDKLVEKYRNMVPTYARY
jgi:hypothetical protein